MALPGDYKKLKNKWLNKNNKNGSPLLDSLISISSNTVSDFYAEVSKGNIEGHAIANMQGENLDVDSSAPENLWCAGGLMVYPTVGEQWEVVSDSTDDTASGIGAQAIIVQYLDFDYNEQTEVVTLNGTTPVQMTATDCFRSINILSVQVGSSGYNQGTVSVSDTSSGNTRVCMEPLHNRSAHGFFTIPKGKTGYLIYGHSALGKNKDGKIELYLTEGENGIFTKNSFSDLYQNSVVFLPKAPIGEIVEKTDIQFLCTTLNNNTDATAFIQILLVDNDLIQD